MELELGCEMYRQATTPTHLAGRACDMVRLLKGDHMKLGYAVDMYTHSIQTATRAYLDGANDEIIVCALLHDVGEMLSPTNHGDVSAGILRPYISRKSHWMLANHEVFQGYYYFDKFGEDVNRREQLLKGGGGSGSCVTDPLLAGKAPEGAYDLAVDFCEKYDALSFDPNFTCMELEDFQPFLLNVFSKEPFWDQRHNLKTSSSQLFVEGPTTLDENEYTPTTCERSRQLRVTNMDFPLGNTS